MRASALISRRGALLGAVLGLLAGASACQSPGEQAAQLRLKFIDDTLLTASEALARDNDGLVRAIHAQVDKNQRPAAELRVLRRAEAVHDSTQQLIGYLRELRGRLLRQTGNELHFRQLDGRREVAALLGRGSAADSLQRRLRRHARYLQQLAPAPDPLPPADFTEASVTGALAMLAGQETRLLLREAEALAVLRARVMTSVLKTSYRALASADNNVVAPGSTYRADLLLAAALYRPSGFTMTANGQPVAAGPDGFGQVAFAVPPLRGAAWRQASWVGSITVRHNGRDTTFQATVPYTIVPRR